MAARFRFTDPEDVAAYGDGWWVWDWEDLARIRGRELIELEEQIDMPLVVVRRDMPTGSTMATMAAMWIAIGRAGGPAGAWDSFNPAVNLATWERVPEVPLESGGDQESDSDSSTTPAPSPESATS